MLKFEQSCAQFVGHILVGGGGHALATSPNQLQVWIIAVPLHSTSHAHRSARHPHLTVGKKRICPPIAAVEVSTQRLGHTNHKTPEVEGTIHTCASNNYL